MPILLIASLSLPLAIAHLFSIPFNDISVSPQTAYRQGVSPVTECQLLVAQIEYNRGDLTTSTRSIAAEPVQVPEASSAYR